jgi:predicted nucleic acid-binding protein
MMIFVDTSAFLAIFSVSDQNHLRAELCFREMREERQTLVTSNYVILESIALLQKRFGLDKVRGFQSKLVPLIQIEWIDKNQHEAAIQAVFQENRRGLSLVDCTVFQTMRRLGIETAFTFDGHFREEGFKVIP